MSELVANCPRCHAKHITFDLRDSISIGEEYGWKTYYEAFCICRHCKRTSIVVLADRDIGSAGRISERGGLEKMRFAVNDETNVITFITTKDTASVDPPAHIPESIRNAFGEGAKCISVGCFNASATMFRLCVDLATRPLLPPDTEESPSRKVRRELGLRLPWLFDNNLLPASMQDLASCIKEDGNDGAHTGTLSQEDAEDLLDFTMALLERLYTEPERLNLARQRRDKRRST